MASFWVVFASAASLGSGMAPAVWTPEQAPGVGQQRLVIQVAQTSVRSFNIPKQSLRNALLVFGHQTGMQISSDPASLAGLQAPAIEGDLTPRQALKQLLKGTKLTPKFIGQRAVVVSQPNPVYAQASTGTTLDAITVVGDDDSDGDGEAAKNLPYETPGSVNYIAAETIARFPGSTAGDIFKGTPGVISGMNRNGAAIDVNIRGMQGMNRVSTTIDGAEQSTSTWRGYSGVDNRTYIDPDLISGATITKGPDGGSVGAIGGTVAIETLNISDILKAGDKYGVRIKGSVGSSGIFPELGLEIPRTERPSTSPSRNGSFSAAYATTAENIDIVAAYVRRKSGNYFVGTQGDRTYIDEISGLEKKLSETEYGEEAFNTSEDATSYLLKSTMRLGNGQTLKLGYLRYENLFGEVSPIINSGRVGREVPLSSITIDQFTARYKWNPTDNDLIDFKLDTSMSNIEEDTVRSIFINSYHIFTRSKNYSLSASNKSRFDIASMPFTLGYGGSIKLEDASPTEGDDPTSGIISIEGTRQVSSLFVSGKLEPASWLSVDANLRYLTYDIEHLGTSDSTYLQYLSRGNPPYTGYEGEGLSPSFGVLVTPIDGWQVFANYTTGIRPPSLREGTFSTSFLVFSPDLEAEQAQNWEIGTN